MKVLLAAVSSSSRPDGIIRHAANVAHAIALHANVERVDLVFGTWQRDAFTSLLESKEDRITLTTAQARNTSFSRNYWHWTGLPQLAAAFESDIVHMAYPAPIHKRAFRRPTVVTLHDLYPYDIPANFGYPRVFVNRIILQQCLRAVDSIACVSDSTMQRLEVDLPTSIVEKATTIYNSVNSGKPVASKNPCGGWYPDPFLLCVAQHRRNKNLPLAIHLLRRLIDSADVPHNTRLLIVGTDGPETAAIKRLIRKSALEANVLLLQGVSDETLNWYYSHCELLIATSTIEGFGLPIVEAMHHRCRVVCSDIPAFREVGGSYCDYVPLGDDAVAAFAKAIRTALKDKRFRAAETDQFSPPRVGCTYLNLYSGLLQAAEQHSPGGRQAPVPALERGRP
ncbi:glycosyltransferase involved in cell wall biosynthesis [Granulicella aggregans]|uniref:Glycosyltransferase involved in cell wall biosynthesis n=1 Tax=Granulicella aggregans TaxID=474949 RepID=A0A7W7ZH12_9BACT|nr:glycosyltransferase family 1 protein [Granulicella aggregans]MBB5059682.1 glycosyltransferase involved in cell wall biosynthesis [Granulicella aggregans]